MKFNKISILIICAVISLLLGDRAMAQAENTCLECHLEIDYLPADYREDDIHHGGELGCVACHGGDATEFDMDAAKAPGTGFVGKPKHIDIPELCGKCHGRIEYMRAYRPQIQTDQVDQYYESLHGKELKKGNQSVAQCASCHTAHGILAVNDPRSSVYALNLPGTCNHCHGNADLMEPFGLKTNQYHDYAASVHGVALLKDHDTGAPACNDCHGNHGAAPPGTESIAHICGTCHLTNMELFLESKMAQSMTSRDFHSCEECHGKHAILEPTDEMLNPMSNSSTCMRCHSEDDPGYATSLAFYRIITGADSLYQRARAELKDVQIKGMNDVDIEYLLKDAHQNLIHLRTLVHSFDADTMLQKASEGMDISSEAILLAGAELEEFSTRRKGFGLSTLAFVLLAIGLYLKIRQNSAKPMKEDS